MQSYQTNLLINLKIFAHHGVFEQETENGQNFYVNAKLYVDMERAGETDALDDAVNYGEVCLFLDSFLKEHTYKLLEKAVTETMQAVLVQFPAVNGLELELSKPQAPIPLSFETIAMITAAVLSSTFTRSSLPAD